MADTPVIGTDTSQFQPPIDQTYTRKFATVRVCDGSYLDPIARDNIATCVVLRKRKLTKLFRSTIKNFAGYGVFEPGMNAAVYHNFEVSKFPTDAVVMIDVERWGNKIRGDHSAEITALAEVFRKRQGGRSDLVWVYGNRGDLDEIYPHRPAWLGIVVASYGSEEPASPGPGPLVGWQYTDGSRNNPVPHGYPTASAPFGHCDHNVFYSTPLPTKPSKPPVHIPTHAPGQPKKTPTKTLKRPKGAAKVVHTVVDGDTLSSIAAKWHVSLKALEKANPYAGHPAGHFDAVRPGDKIVHP